jgi:F-type H+-transporting ATPase subunit alpha
MRPRDDESRGLLRQQITARDAPERDMGTIASLGDGVAHVHGLRDCMAGELLRFGADVRGLAFDLYDDAVVCGLLDHGHGLTEGDPVERTGRLAQLPCGTDLLGRVIDPLGRPLDGGPPLSTGSAWPLEYAPAGIDRRRPAADRLHTGLKAIDHLRRLPRGSSQLLLGEARTGKTSVALDAILAQTDSGVLCVYVAVGQKEAAVSAAFEHLRQGGALAHTVVVSAPASAPPAAQYLAPFAGCAVAEFFTYTQGRDALCVHDDLTRHANAYRDFSLLLRRPAAGRGPERYPADLLSCRARLLERAVCLAAGGALTVLAIAQTQEGDVSAPVTADLVSLTDGQIHLRADLFRAGIRPAVDRSTHPAGGLFAPPKTKWSLKGLWLDLAASAELEAYARLGTELDRATRLQLERGRRLIELLNQTPGRPMPAVDQFIVLYAGTQGYLESLPLARVHAFEEGLLADVHARRPDVLRALNDARHFDGPVRRTLEEAIEEFKFRFVARKGA